ncbi:MAG: hypothetical protein OFPI_40900 [Osedax symbiont Rs2]|nr:MAG: hypothetical protein OFPI_40900 [Osedax symbiont Rs2]
MIIKTSAALCTAILMTAQSAAATPKMINDELQLNLQEYVGLVTRQNIQIKTRKLDWKDSKFSIEIEKADFDPVLSLSANRNANRRLNSVQQQLSLSSISEFKEQNTEYDVAISKKMQLGGTLKFSLNLEALDNNIQPDFIRGRESVVFAGLTMTQPLLQNRGIGTTAPLKVAQIGEKLAFQGYRNARSNVVYQAINGYWDLYEADFVTSLREQTVNKLGQLLKINQRRASLGNVPATDVLLLKSRLANAQSRLQLAKLQQEDSLNTAKYFMGVSSQTESYSVRTKNSGLRKELAKLIADHKSNRPDVDTAMSGFYAGNADYLSSLMRAEQENLRLDYAGNQALPKLDLTASYGVNGLGTGSSDAIDNAFNGETRANWSVGLNFSTPLNNRKGKNSVSSASLKKRQALNDIEETKIKLGNHLVAMIQGLDLKNKNIKALKRAWDSDQQTYNLMRNKYKNGNSSIENVIESEQQLTVAKEQVLLSMTNYQKSLFLVKQIDGSLFSHFNIDE